MGQERVLHPIGMEPICPPMGVSRPKPPATAPPSLDVGQLLSALDAAHREIEQRDVCVAAKTTSDSNKSDKGGEYAACEEIDTYAARVCIHHVDATTMSASPKFHSLPTEKCGSFFNGFVSDEEAHFPIALKVQVDRECLLGYHMSDDWQTRRCQSAPSTPWHRSTGGLNESAICLKLPLFLASAHKRYCDCKASVSRDGGRANQHPGCRHIDQDSKPKFWLQVDVPPAETTALLQAVKLSAVEPIPANPAGSWLFEFDCEDDVRSILRQLQAAGCVMRELEDRYSLGEIVGVGGSCKVHLADDKHTGESVAIKICLRRGIENDVSILREATILRWARHPSVLQFKGIYEAVDEPTGRGTWAIVTEFVGGGELFDEVRRHGPLSEERAKSVVTQLFSAINFLHQRGIIHRDIKTENVVLVCEGSDDIKLVDFGLAAPEWDKEYVQMLCGSPGYIAPEVLRCEAYDSKVDCFSIGVLSYILLAGHAPFRGSLDQMLERNLRCRPSFQGLVNISSDAKDLLKKLLTANPDVRPSAEECLRHPWLARTREQYVSATSQRSSNSSFGMIPTPPDGCTQRRPRVGKIRRRLFSEQLSFPDILFKPLRFADSPRAPCGRAVGGEASQSLAKQFQSMSSMETEIGVALAVSSCSSTDDCRRSTLQQNGSLTHSARCSDPCHNHQGSDGGPIRGHDDKNLNVAEKPQNGFLRTSHLGIPGFIRSPSDSGGEDFERGGSVLHRPSRYTGPRPTAVPLRSSTGRPTIFSQLRAGRSSMDTSASFQFQLRRSTTPLWADVQRALSLKRKESRRESRPHTFACQTLPTADILGANSTGQRTAPSSEPSSEEEDNDDFDGQTSEFFTCSCSNKRMHGSTARDDKLSERSDEVQCLDSARRPSQDLPSEMLSQNPGAISSAIADRTSCKPDENN